MSKKRDKNDQKQFFSQFNLTIHELSKIPKTLNIGTLDIFCIIIYCMFV